MDTKKGNKVIKKEYIENMMYFSSQTYSLKFTLRS